MRHLRPKRLRLKYLMLVSSFPTEMEGLYSHHLSLWFILHSKFCMPSVVFGLDSITHVVTICQISAQISAQCLGYIFNN